MNQVYQLSSKKGWFFTNLKANTILIGLNVLLFIIFTIFLGLKILSIDMIFLNPSNIFSGKYIWTFLTSMFMHGGIWHLFVNMISMIFVGGLVEKILGFKRYFWFYLISGLFAGSFFVSLSLFSPSNFNAYAVGASGALFGLIGLLVLITPNLRVYLMFIPIPIKMKYAGPGILIVLWLISATPMIFGGESIKIGNTAHLGGLIAGLIYGFYLRKKFPNKIKMLGKYFR